MDELEINPSHSFEIEDAIRLGSIEKALILKEIRRMAIYKVRNKKSPWVFYSAQALSEKFPYMARKSIDRWMRELEESKELVSKIDNKLKYDKTKSYTLAQFETFVGQNEPSIGQNEAWDGQNGLPIPPLSSSNTPLSELGNSQDSKQELIRKTLSQATIVNDNESSTSVKRARRWKDKESIFRLFGELPEPWWHHAQENAAALRLFDMKGFEEVSLAMDFLKKHKNDQFCPVINRPFALEKKWDDLLEYRNRNNL